MNINEILRSLFLPKSCFYVLKLRTGCYIIAGLYLFLGLTMFYQEFRYAVRVYSDIENEKRLSVAFLWDLNPMVFSIFSISLFYGLYKENVCLIYPMYIMLMNTEFEILMDMITSYIESHIYGFTFTYFPPLIFYGILNGYTAVVMYGHCKEITAAKTIKKTTSTKITEFENQNCT